MARAQDAVTFDDNVLPVLRQRVYGLALGYEDLNDHQTLRTDPVLQLSANQLPDADTPLASAPTLCRLENRVDRKALFKMVEDGEAF